MVGVAVRPQANASNLVERRLSHDSETATHKLLRYPQTNMILDGEAIMP